MDRIDHVTEAVALRQLASVTTHVESAANLVAAAQVHATLALVEQQQIANLIALATGQNTFEGISRRASDVAHAALVSDPNGDLRPEIAAALGIEVAS